ncbi:hypothetical protein [Oscillatoria sp. FACHB-1406]|nr:hypothetical protein [Oscillatoria sp. FACHB-1406]MBD2577672.1 hypothetical protein [Oscillatoria sp. FACHB-1406]
MRSKQFCCNNRLQLPNVLDRGDGKLPLLSLEPLAALPLSDPEFRLL